MGVGVRYIWAVLAVTMSVSVLTSCSEECTDNKNALPLAGFYSSETPAEKVSVSGLEVYGLGAPNDSILSPGSETKGEVYLPFRIDSDTTAYVFRYSYTEAGDSIPKVMADTVTFVYSRTPRFVNVECGVSYNFGIRDIVTKGELIDSVTCPMGYIDNADIENLRIYFAPNPATEPENPE